MNAVKAVEDILRPKSPSESSGNYCTTDSSSVENQHSYENRTTLIKMAGTTSGSGASASSGPAVVAAVSQQTSTVCTKWRLFYIRILTKYSIW